MHLSKCVLQCAMKKLGEFLDLYKQNSMCLRSATKVLTRFLYF